MSKVPSIGAMDRRLVLEYAQRKTDGAGGFTTTWLALADVWAHVETRGGSERFDGGGSKGVLMSDITVRARPEIVPSRRFREGARIFQIQAVQPHADDLTFLLCRCEQRNL
jgi:SPP1 family predicted phage head-tail adaptor